MIEELNILGVYSPAALAWGVSAAVIVYLLRTLAQQTPLYRLLWHPGLVELVLFVLLWLGLGAIADHLF